MPDDRVLLRSKFYKGSRGETREVRYFGNTILWDEEVWVFPFIHRELFKELGDEQRSMNQIQDSILETMKYPWKRKCLALVKEGPKAMVLYQGGN
jgi:hypothetical protein